MKPTQAAAYKEELNAKINGGQAAFTKPARLVPQGSPEDATIQINKPAEIKQTQTKTPQKLNNLEPDEEADPANTTGTSTACPAAQAELSCTDVNCPLFGAYKNNATAADRLWWSFLAPGPGAVAAFRDNCCERDDAAICSGFNHRGTRGL